MVMLDFATDHPELNTLLGDVTSGVIPVLLGVYGGVVTLAITRFAARWIIGLANRGGKA